METLIVFILKILGNLRVATASTVALGRLWRRRNDAPVTLDRAAYAYLFALALGAVRYVWAS